jgi:hypothetical protein
MARLFFILSLVLCLFGCGTMPPRPTIGQELCATGCKVLGGEYHNMSEQERKCYCVFKMPSSLSLGQPGPRPAQGSESTYAQAQEKN